jgi:hypothetical protein
MSILYNEIEVVILILLRNKLHLLEYYEKLLNRIS